MATSPDHGRRRRRRLAGTVAAFLCLVATACDAGVDAQSNARYQPAAGVSVRTGTIFVLNTLVVANEQGQATVVVVLLNNGTTPDVLKSYEIQNLHGHYIDGDLVTARGGGPLVLPVAQAVPIPAAADLSAASKEIVPGRFVAINFTFEKAEPLRVEAPVVPNQDIYSTVPVG